MLSALEQGVFTDGAIFAAMRLLEKRVSRPWLRALLVIAVCWGPLALLCAMAGTCWGHRVEVPLLKDYATYARFWVALPVLIFVRPFSGYWLQTVVHYLAENALVLPAQRTAFQRIWERFLRFTNNTIVDCVLLGIALLLILLQLPFRLPADIAGWHLSLMRGRLVISPAGYWFLLVSNLLLVTLVLKWGWVYLQWIGVLHRLARLPLHLNMIHPDRRGGLGIVPVGHTVFLIPVSAIGMVLLGILVNSQLYFHVTRSLIEMIVLIYAATAALLLVAPLFVFTPLLISTRRKGLMQFSSFAGTYVRDFATKWYGPSTSHAQESPLGSSDIQSLADLAHSYSLVATMYYTMVDLRSLLVWLAAILLPLSPLLFLLLPIHAITTLVLTIVKHLL